MLLSLLWLYYYYYLLGIYDYKVNYDALKNDPFNSLQVYVKEDLHLG